MIRIEDVTKRYDEHTVVDNISTTIPRGKFTSVIGPNGAGKSTLLQMIARLEPITEGAVLIDDLDVSTTPGPELARTMSILRQENHLVVRLTVRELVEFGRFPHTQGRLTADDKNTLMTPLNRWAWSTWPIMRWMSYPVDSDNGLSSPWC